MKRYVLITQFGFPYQVDSADSSSLNFIGIAALVGGITLLARIPRLAIGRGWYVFGFGSFALGAATYVITTPLTARFEAGSIFAKFGTEGPKIGVLWLSFVVGLIGLLAKMPSHEFHVSEAVARGDRWLLKGMRPLLVCGVLDYVSRVLPLE